MAEPSKPKDTKQALLAAAGALFAERGFGGTSIRDIVGKAEVTLSAVNYHFGTKEQIYEETIRYVLSEKMQFGDCFSRLGRQCQATPQEVADAVHQDIRDLFFSYLVPGQPEWYGLLINRATIESHPDMESVFQEIVQPMTDRIRRLLLEHVPTIDPPDVSFWIHSVFGQIHYYVMARRVILKLHEIDNYDESFLEEAAAYIARHAVRALGLPEPRLGIREGETHRHKEGTATSIEEVRSVIRP